MTIIAGFSSSRQGSAPLNLAAQLARTTGEKIIAAVVVERALPAGVDPIEDEYRGFLASRVVRVSPFLSQGAGTVPSWAMPTSCSRI